MNNFQLIIMGGGASGMVAAITAKTLNPQLTVAILEKAPRLGKKLLATGNGRCNIGNAQALPSNYHSASGDGGKFVAPALTCFSPVSNKEFWQSLGVLVKEEAQGKEYPYSLQAAGVLDCLRLALANLDIQVFTECQVSAIKPEGQGLMLATGLGSFACECLLVACGGLASPQLSNSQGWQKLFAPLKHGGISPFPALVQIKTVNIIPKALKGSKINAIATLYTQGEAVGSCEGEVLFTEYGLSGPPIFDLSRQVAVNFVSTKPKPQHITLDTMPEYTMASLTEMLLNRQQKLGHLALEDFLTGMLQKRLGQQIFKATGLAPLSMLAGKLTPDNIQSLAVTIKSLPLEVTGTTGWQNAQVMAGGLDLADFDPATLGSKQVKGLFAAGEILDIDGDCGGYNLTWAWSSGRLAATSAVNYLTNK